MSARRKANRFAPEVLSTDPARALEFLGLPAATTEEEEATTRITPRVSTSQLVRLRAWGLKQKPAITKDAALVRALIDRFCEEG